MKLIISTNISDKKMDSSEYGFHYSFEENFKGWCKDCGKEEIK